MRSLVSSSVKEGAAAEGKLQAAREAADKAVRVNDLACMDGDADGGHCMGPDAHFTMISNSRL